MGKDKTGCIDQEWKGQERSKHGLSVFNWGNLKGNGWLFRETGDGGEELVERQTCSATVRYVSAGVNGHRGEKPQASEFQQEQQIGLPRERAQIRLLEF